MGEVSLEGLSEKSVDFEVLSEVEKP